MSITLEDATRLAQKHVDEISSAINKELCLYRAEQFDRERFWAFTYNTSAFAKSRDPRQALMGNGPIIVDKATSAVHQVPTGGMLRWLETY